MNKLYSIDPSRSVVSVAQNTPVSAMQCLNNVNYQVESAVSPLAEFGVLAVVGVAGILIGYVVAKA